MTAPTASPPDPRPRSVILAVWFLSLALAIGVSIIVWAWKYPTIGLATFVLIGGLILAIALRQNWARWALAAVTLATLVVSLEVVRFQLTYGVVLPIATSTQLALEGVAFVLLFRPPASRWFRRRPQ